MAGYPARGASRARLRSSRRRRPIGRPRATWCQPTIPGPHGPAERGGAGPSSACTGSGAATLCGGGEKAHSERTPEPSGRPARSVLMCGFVRAVSMYDVRPLRNDTIRVCETAQVHCGDSARVRSTTVNPAQLCYLSHECMRRAVLTAERIRSLMRLCPTVSDARRETAIARWNSTDVDSKYAFVGYTPSMRYV